MPDRLNRPRPVLVLILLLSLVHAAFGIQDAPPAAQPPPPVETTAAEQPPVDVEAIQQRIGELQQLDQEDEAVKSELELQQRTLSSMQELDADRTATEEFRSRAGTAPERIEQIQAELAVPLEDAIPPLPEAATLDELNGLLQSAQGQLAAAKKLRDDVETEQNTRTTRLATIPDLIAQTTQSLQQIEESLDTPADPNDTSPLALASQQNLEVRQLALQAKLVRLDEEILSYNARSDTIRLRRDQAERQVVIAERTVTQLQERVDLMRTAEADRTRREAEAAQRAAADAHAVVRTITEETARLAEDNQRVTDLIQQYNGINTETEAIIAQWRAELDNIRLQEESVGLNEVLGLRLRSQQLQLPVGSVLKNRLQLVRGESLSAQASLFDLDSGSIVDRSEAFDRLIEASGDPIPPGEEETVRAAGLEALTAQSDLRRKLQGSYDEYLKTLNTLHQTTQELVDLAEDYNDYINLHILWIRSSGPLGLDDFRQLDDAILYFFGGENWLALGATLRRDFEIFWPMYVIVGMILALLLILRPRLRRLLLDTGEQVVRVTTDRFAHTVRALIYTILLAILWPAAIWFLSWRLNQTPVLHDFVTATAAALARMTLLLFFLEFIWHLCRSGGLGEAHFHWKSGNLRRVRREVRWFAPLIIPLGFVVLVMNAVAPDVYRDSLGRLAFMVCLPIMSIVAYRLFHPDKGIPAHLLGQQPNGLVNRLRYVWFGLIVLGPLALVVTTAMGFAYTSLKLDEKLNDTAIILIVIFVLHSMLMRWLIFAQRKLAVEQAMKKRAAAIAAAEAEAEAAEQARSEGKSVEPPATEPPPVLEVREVDVKAISAQTRNMLRTIMKLTTLFILLAAWADVMPAFGVLNDVRIGGLTTTEMVNGDPISVPVTLADLAVAIIVLVVLFMVNRNLPGLMEIVVLQRLPISAGARYAIVTLSRYFLIIVGVIIAFEQVGIGWSQVQWLAAAITVGLGFGLQEIFANFVSGIILLFERPVRVGDTVTVGQISGTVSRIQMRATTITDWDRKELIIPNKEFVTGQIINWTLSDAVLRIRIPVGIAFGSDTELARSILLRCAAENDRILEDPAPMAVFNSFGEDALEFELRVFIPSIDHMVSARHELHESIDQAFHSEGVEIAFPQHDLHIRSISPAVEVIGNKRVMDVQTDPIETTH